MNIEKANCNENTCATSTQSDLLPVIRYNTLRHTICLAILVPHDLTYRYNLQYHHQKIHLQYNKFASHSVSEPKLPMFTITEPVTVDFKFRAKVKSILKQNLLIKKKYVHKIKFLCTHHKYFHTFLVILKKQISIDNLHWWNKVDFFKLHHDDIPASPPCQTIPVSPSLVFQRILESRDHAHCPTLFLPMCHPHIKAGVRYKDVLSKCASLELS